MRASQGLIEAIPPEDLREYHDIMKKNPKIYAEVKPPAMACYGEGKFGREDYTSQGLPKS